MAVGNVETDIHKSDTKSVHNMESSNFSTETQSPSPQKSAPFKPSCQIYAIVIGLGIANLLAALENTVLTIAAPVVLTDLQLGDNFIWVTNAFFPIQHGSATSLQPIL